MTIRANPAQMHNRESLGGYDGWCPICGQPMDWLATPRQHWNICDRCHVAWSPGSSLGDASEGWETQLRRLDKCRELTDDEYLGPGYAAMSEDTGRPSA
jgi:hypothetical protein